jgi:hypothetical protein
MTSHRIQLVDQIISVAHHLSENTRLHTHTHTRMAWKEVVFGPTGMAWNGESRFWPDWNGIEWGSRFWPDWNGLEWRK